MDNTVYKEFDGDIIITDPCYIINKDNEDDAEYPSWWDYVSKVTTTERDDGKGGTYIRYNMPKPEDYPDYREKKLDDYTSKIDQHIAAAEMFLSKYKPIMFSPTLQAELDEYHKAEDKYHSVPHDDWERCEYGKNMEALGIHNHITRRTNYGDWSCTTYDLNTHKVLGEFCADAGMVSVFLLDEVLKYNPKFENHIKYPHTTTLIKDFKGKVWFRVDPDDSVRVRGSGVNKITNESIEFITEQTNF